MNIAYNMDCMEYMRTLPDKAFDLAVTDPPYGIGENGSKNHTRRKLAMSRDYKAFCLWRKSFCKQTRTSRIFLLDCVGQGKRRYRFC